MPSLKTWYPPTVPQIDKLSGVERTIEHDKATIYDNGYCWAKGICTTYTLKGSTSTLWKLGFWRAGGRNPPLVARQTSFAFNANY